MIGRAFFLFFLVVFVTAFFMRSPSAQTVPCYDIEIAEKSLKGTFDERIIGIGVTFTGDLMKLFVAPNGRWTIAVVPAGRAGMLCPIHYGDGFTLKKAPARSRGKGGSLKAPIREIR